MPIHGYTGNVITANPTAPTVSAATGVWTTEQQLQAVAAGNWPGYEYPISRSLRFNSADSAYLNRTPASATNRETWTWSGWVKRTSVTNTGQNLFSTDNGSSTTTGQLFFNDAILEFNCYASSAYQWRLITTQVWRDLSAWYHIVAVLDTTQATSSNRVKLYVNGVQITAFTTATYPSQGFDGAYNLNQPHYVGAAITSSGYLNGYLTEVNFIDGQALEPSSFGLNDPETGVWSPKRYTGTYGTNGFYLNFSDNSGTTSTTLGKDSSGNGNNWTPNNFSVTAGAGNDSLVDTPTNYGTDTGIGGSVRGNYCTLNPLKNEMTLSNGNLALSGGLDTTTTATMAVPSTGKWYFEFVPTSMPASNANIGLASSAFAITNSTFAYAEHRVYIQNGNKADVGGSVAYGASWTTSDVIGVAVDMDAGTLVFYKNNTSQGTAFSDLVSSGKTWFPLAANYGSGTFEGNFNFGQREFAYTAPSGFKALCTQNLPTPTIGATSTTQAGKYFNPVLYTGTGSTQSITGVGFAPDFIWQKERSSNTGGGSFHYLSDKVRGVNAILQSNTTGAESTGTDVGINTFDSDGFTMGTYGGGNANQSGESYVAWNWKANGAGSSNTAGTITSTVSANTTSGFSIVTYTGTGANATVGHGLGVAPSMVIVKKRSGTSGWVIGFTFTGFNWATDYFQFDTAAKRTDGAGTVFTTTPSSTVFSIGTDGSLNGSSATFVAYCFAPVAGYSAFGSYTGNGSADGAFIYTGFRPRYVLIKQTNTSSFNWCLVDTSRNPYNESNNLLFPNISDAETTTGFIDVLSNGFKARNASGYVNGSGSTYIYAAFAESPFKYALAR
jgi:hypothetical protein